MSLGAVSVTATAVTHTVAGSQANVNHNDNNDDTFFRMWKINIILQFIKNCPMELLFRSLFVLLSRF